MPTLYTRTFRFKESLSDAQVVEEWRYLLNEVVPAIQRVPGVRSVKAYSRAGALRADLTAFIEMDDAAVYERLLVNPEVSRLLGRMYGGWDMNTAGQSFRREVTPELISALSGAG